MKKRQFVKESVIKVSSDELFEWHMSKNALEKLIPPWEPVTVASQPDDLSVEGAEVTLEITILGPISIRWIARHQNIIKGKQFQDVQEKGPFAYWQHTHKFESRDENSSILRDEIEYALPLGIIGDFFGNWLVERKLNTMFEFRHKITKRELESEE